VFFFFDNKIEIFFLIYLLNLTNFAKFSPNVHQIFYVTKVKKEAYISVFFSNSGGKLVGDFPKEGLAKFGYMLERKVKKFRNPAICWRRA
jgi:hypothetical protein